MAKVRHPAVAGLFYPSDPEQLHETIRAFLDAAPPPRNETPKALIVPHAGYIYSGPIAASAYAQLLPARGSIERVVLLGPSHRVGFQGVAVSSADVYATPLGNVPLDRSVIDHLLTLPFVHTLDEAHLYEHSLEVHLPFLQEVLQHFSLVPLVIGQADPEEVAQVLELTWGGDETLIVVSSDLSHYHDYFTAQRLDAATSRAIEKLQGEAIGYDDACGCIPVAGLLTAAKRHGLSGKTIDLRNSGDTAGDRRRVVGYGAYVFQ